MPALLFVCLGNICRSPMAAALCRHLIQERADAGRWTVDSAGTAGWHEGSPPDPRTRAVLRAHNVAIAHRARQVIDDDYRRYDLLLAMDNANLEDLRLRIPKYAGRVRLLGEFGVPPGQEVPDPYHSDGLDAFEAVYRQLDDCLRGLLARYPVDGSAADLATI
jgi:protein-tyrosine phosphatase